jgi:hypothetical protein
MSTRKPPPEKPLREWRILIMRDRSHYLGRVVASDKEAAIDRAMEEFRIEPARRFRLIAEPDGAGARSRPIIQAAWDVIERGEKTPVARCQHRVVPELELICVLSNARLEAAFSATRREDFLGDGPRWMLRGPRGYITTPDADPVYLYTDDLVGILPERHLNNGQPSLQGAPAVAGSLARSGGPSEHATWSQLKAKQVGSDQSQRKGDFGRTTAPRIDTHPHCRAQRNILRFYQCKY